MAMDLHTSSGSDPATPATAIEGRLNLALRLAASQASSLVGGAGSLIFTTTTADSPSAPRLRAAAGFSSPDDAREAANQAESLAANVIATGEPETAPGLKAQNEILSTLVLPLVVPGRTLGALVIGNSADLSAERRDALESLAWSVSTQLDYSTLSADLEKLRNESNDHLSIADEKTDELLKLSEELFAQDIELLRNNEKLGKIEKLKNDFIEKMSRELRTPLNSIIEATITVLAGENDNLSESSQQTLRKALDEGTAFQRTLENILDLWRIKQNEFPVETQELSFAEVIDETIFSVGDTLGEKPVEIIKVIPEPLPRVRGDLAKINQILFLLLDNAAKFIEEGTIKIGARYENERLYCSIEDTGIGICADDQKYVWNEFYQVDDRASAKYRGAGLGLTLVHDLLILLNGDSMLESEPGKGTRVEFSVPVTLA
jgi:signal transduction histidine kinase